MTSQFPADSNASANDGGTPHPNETLDDILGSVGGELSEPLAAATGEPMVAEVMSAEVMGAEIVGAEIVGAELVGAEVMGAEVMGAEVMSAEVMNANVVTAESTPEPLPMFAPIVASPTDSATDLADLQAQRARLQGEIQQAQEQLHHLFQDSLGDLERRRQNLQLSVEQLERRHDRIRAEMRSTFAGSSQEVAVRVQSFKDYLVGSLQDLVRAADQLELVREVPTAAPMAEMETVQRSANGPLIPVDGPIGTIQFAEPSFADKTAKIRQVIELFRNEPDYYGPAWKLRRTFESVHAERINEWFFTQGGRGAVRTVGSRLQNILVASAAISILYNLYGERLRPLILANSPERLGEWRRGLQDCLGVGKNDFGADRGLTLFELPEPMSQRAERIQKDGKLPLIIIDESEEFINLSVLQFPLWLAFAPNPQSVPQPSYFY
jgi:Protein of unknown function (DUF3086)